MNDEIAQSVLYFSFFPCVLDYHSNYGKTLTIGVVLVTWVQNTGCYSSLDCSGRGGKNIALLVRTPKKEITALYPENSL